MNILFDPKIFNYVIMGLYAANSVRWAFHGSWADVSLLAVRFGELRQL